MTSSITEYTNESLRRTSEPGCLINMPELQAHKSGQRFPPCRNEVKAVIKDEKEANTDFAKPTPV